MRPFTAALLAGSSLFVATAASAAPAEERPAPTADDTTPAPQNAQTRDIVVIGKGETRQVQTIGQADIVLLAPGTSALKAVEKLPSVNFQSADPFGAYEWSERISIRGFSQTQGQIGFTLDGIPLGDGAYGNVNGLHISRAISSENIAETRVSQGAGAIGTQATNNLGGTLEFFSAEPKADFGVDVNATYGSNDAVRLFARMNTGEWSALGIRGYLSYAYSDTDKWKGWRSQRQNQVNAKVVVPLGADFRIVGTTDFSDRRENDYQDMSLDMIRRLGRDWDNISNNYALAVRVADVGANIGYTGVTPTNPAAGTTYPAPFASADDAYFDAAGLRRDWLHSIGIETVEGNPVHATLKGYAHDNHGQGIWYTPYVASPSGVPISIRTTEYDINRKGVFGNVGTAFGFNDITVGGWYENNQFEQARRFYGLTSRTDPGRDSLEFQTNPFYTQWDYLYTTDTVQYYVQDKLSFDALTINLGWKGYDVRSTADAIVPGSLASGKIKVTDWFQPHAGFAYTLGSAAEVFGGFTEVTRAFVAAGTSGPFATTQAGFNAVQSGVNKLKPETSDTYELGLRFRQGGFSGSLAGYYVDFHNRMVALTVGTGIQGNPAVLQNVGSVRSIGAEAAGEYRFGHGFSIYAAYSYNDSTYRDDVTSSAGTVATKGKTVVDAPKHMLKGEVAYDGPQFLARIGANYMSKRYFTYTNDQSVPAQTLVDATIGYKLRLADGRQVEIQGNVTNLFDEDYIATIGTNGFTNSGDNQTLLPGAPRQFFITLKTGL